MSDTERSADFGVCPHCWHLNGPLSRICLRCRADMTLILQESGGERWAAPVQSPVPVGGTGRRALSSTQRIMLLGFLVLFGLGQLLVAFAPSGSWRPVPGAPRTP